MNMKTKLTDDLLLGEQKNLIFSLGVKFGRVEVCYSDLLDDQKKPVQQKMDVIRQALINEVSQLIKIWQENMSLTYDIKNYTWNYLLGNCLHVLDAHIYILRLKGTKIQDMFTEGFNF